MNIEMFETNLNTQENFQKVYSALNNFIESDENTIDYDSYEHELNEVLYASLDSMDISEVLELEIDTDEASFESLIEVTAEIEITDNFGGEDITETITVNFNVAIIGQIDDEDNVIIDGIESIEEQ
ncbi:hypothetical protein P9436_05235 [Lysinibacillus capsici]|uniref:hypothetical protein n=1 Tax=Lysinibacillus capsici TaxID=2115968 RepID=UPI00029C8880|nr:hypothetical protein [Lysinibacillus capsici]EKU41281.1 hypothetical protein C518_3775 [Lysinibacillus fusiformis ZB2]MED4698449.1 hypothetical protein [Lysinibacillus capsici]